MISFRQFSMISAALLTLTATVKFNNLCVNNAAKVKRLHFDIFPYLFEKLRSLSQFGTARLLHYFSCKKVF